MPEIDPAQVRLTPGTSGLYESYYFRGTSPDGSNAFWLKHNLLRYRGDDSCKVECTVILFDKIANRVTAAHDQTTVGGDRLTAFGPNRQWDNATFEFGSGAHFEISASSLKGKLPGAAWTLHLARSNETLFHFTPPALYTIGWPKKKVLTRDCRVTFTGELSIGDHKIAGTFVGMNGHNWGTEHAHRYAYANCNMWEGGEEAIFDGFSAKVRVAPGITSPFVTLAALKVGELWHHFNRLSAAPWSRVSHLSDYRWAFSAVNRTHRIEAHIDGADPASRPWVALNYHHPSRAQSVVKNTKFATGTIRLIDSASGRCAHEMHSNLFELETLLETNMADPSHGYRAGHA